VTFRVGLAVRDQDLTWIVAGSCLLTWSARLILPCTCLNVDLHQSWDSSLAIYHGDYLDCFVPPHSLLRFCF
jgi:hypothetical protein